MRLSQLPDLRSTSDALAVSRTIRRVAWLRMVVFSKSFFFLVKSRPILSFVGDETNLIVVVVVRRAKLTILACQLTSDNLLPRAN